MPTTGSVQKIVILQGKLTRLPSKKPDKELLYLKMHSGELTLLLMVFASNALSQFPLRE